MYSVVQFETERESKKICSHVSGIYISKTNNELEFLFSLLCCDYKDDNPRRICLPSDLFFYFFFLINILVNCVCHVFSSTLSRS